MTTWYDATADATTIYSYYKGGNLAKIFSDGDLISFTYGGGDGIADRIVVYDGQLLSYDMIGNPLTYRDGMSFTWKNGRQLATFTQGQTSASYNYNESGIRTDKTVNGITTTYQLDGSKIVSENRNGTVQEFFYDESGSVLGIVYNGSNKPNNPQAIARGTNQLNRYTSAASQRFGGKWTGVLKLYD